CLAGLTRPLRGVFHLAAVLDDGPLAETPPARGPESVASVFASRVGGAWHLHQATSGHPLDHFVLLSPVAAVSGHAGRSVPAAASAYLGGLTRYRRHRGQPALAYDLAEAQET